LNKVLNQLITITSDLGNNDYYLATLKGKLYSISSNFNIVDVNNNVILNDIETAAFVIKNTYPYFPEKTIHLIAVANNYSTSNNHVIVKFKNQFFIGTDNGIFSLFIDEDADFEAYTLNKIDANPENSIFPARDIFTKAIDYLINLGFNDGLGEQIFNLKKMFILQSTVSANYISGFVKYIDNFGNLITNIDLDFFLKSCNNRKFQIQMNFGKYKFSEIYLNYNEPEFDADLFAIFNSSGLLEIALKNSSASQLMGLKINDPVRIEFF
jgi:S-adenosylmethionine hydrolase